VTARTTPSLVQDRLRDIQAITDSTLSYLDDHALLDELLDRVREILQADTATVLMLDRSSGLLTATAARGLEEEVHQGVRVPLGRGFAGRIAAEARPLILQHVDDTKVVNPILPAKGLHSLMGVPMMAGGTVIGVMHVGTLQPRSFTSEDAELLQLAADRAATAVQSLLARADQAAAAALQRSLLPSALPPVPGASLAARYVPGNGVAGGDWYDVFQLPTGELCVVIGDVAGSGLRAAVVMGRMRSALRAYALETSDPAEVLARLDRKMGHFEPSALATVMYAVFDPGLARVRISSAGHFPPVIAPPGKPAGLAVVATDLMIGVDTQAPRQAATLAIPPGSLLCFFTDGLVERRDRPIDESLDRLCEVMRAEPPDAACARVMGALVGLEPARDDIALLMVLQEPDGRER
jgi:Stage II sporulation protein E (SpoIIE)/GAF domain